MKCMQAWCDRGVRVEKESWPDCRPHLMASAFELNKVVLEMPGSGSNAVNTTQTLYQLVSIIDLSVHGGMSGIDLYSR